MSEGVDKNVKKKITRGNRGGKGKSNKKSEERSIQDEVIELLRAEGFNITPPVRKPSAEKSKGSAKLSKDPKVPEVFKAILNVCNSRRNEGLKSKKKTSKKSDLSGRRNSDKRGNEDDAFGRRNIEKKEKENEASVGASKIDGEKKSKSKSDKRERAQKKKEAKKLEKRKKRKKLPFEEGKGNEKKSRRPSESIKRKDDKSNKNLTFPKYIRKRDMLKILENQDPNDSPYVKGHVRINPKNFRHAYLNVDCEVDILISGVRERNRALDRDLVVAMINPEEDWCSRENGEIQKTATVVCILEKVHLRKVVGTLEEHGDSLRLKSRDTRVPFLLIDPKNVPEDVKLSPDLYRNTLFLAKIDTWVTPNKCTGIIESALGNVGDLEGETSAILLTNGLDVTPYDDELIEGLPSSDYVPSATDIEEREDWREECVFTIDPATAVDLDDAVSCKKLPNGNYEVGVHISDVTHYLKVFSPLDERVSERATTVYLVNTVFHMLPKPLCNLCSLLPGHEKLSFSVIWEMSPEAEVTKHRFAKSVIKSCYQMSYEKAQAMIDESSSERTEIDLPGLEGKFTANRIREVVNDLYELSTKMRERRFANGALSINQPKLQIILDNETGIPISYRIEERQDSNRLIEEFMLLANMTVAKHLTDTMPETAFLRVHGEPLSRVLSRTAEDLGYLGVHLNTESAASLQSSLSLYEKTGLEGDEQKFASSCRMMVMNALCAQSMLRAKYTCSGMIKREQGLRHFALNVPFYTHFTSPIRRYADCVVHRLLDASITSSPLPDGWSADLCAKIAANCNEKKYSAKVAQEKSSELYFMELLSLKGPTETMAVVMKVKQYSMDVILCYVGITVGLSYSDLDKFADIEYNREHSVSTVIVKWKETGVAPQTINLFSMINLRIEKHPNNYSIRAVLLPSRLNNPTIRT